jgi:cytoskeletal protein RodZ
MAVMKRKLTRAPTPVTPTPVTLLAVLGVCGAVALGGCGSQTKTVTAASAPAATQSTPTNSTSSSTATATTPTTTTTASAPTSTAGGTAAPTSTHTAPEPEFTQQEGHVEGLAGALATLRARGYTPSETSQYHPSQTLRVLVGTRTGSSDGYGQQAFFFLAGRYIGTDTKEPSATVDVLAQSDTEVTLGYPLYRKGDPLASPSGGRAAVRFQLNDGKLVALDPIPPANSASGTSRY